MQTDDSRQYIPPHSFIANPPSQSLSLNTGDDVTHGLLEECKSLGSLCSAGGKTRPVQAARELDEKSVRYKQRGSNPGMCHTQVYVTVKYQTCTAGGVARSDLGMHTGYLEVFRGLPQADAKIALDYTVAVYFQIVSKRYFTNHPAIDSISLKH